MRGTADMSGCITAVADPGLAHTQEIEQVGRGCAGICGEACECAGAALSVGKY
jgi:hypothetical protein